jgi:hypothetical protein
MLGLPCASSSPTSFWSDQYGVRIQFLGHTESADRVEVEGDMEARDFVTVWSQGSRPVAALLVGRPRALAEVRRRLTVAPHATVVGTELEAA